MSRQSKSKRTENSEVFRSPKIAASLSRGCNRILGEKWNRIRSGLDSFRYIRTINKIRMDRFSISHGI